MLTSHRHVHARKAPSELAKLAQLVPGVAPPRAPTSRNLASRLLAATDLATTCPKKLPDLLPKDPQLC